ncbi:type II secretion system protein [bacterium]|nr:type II secretion system protein [bacterium]
MVHIFYNNKNLKSEIKQTLKQVQHDRGKCNFLAIRERVRVRGQFGLPRCFTPRNDRGNNNRKELINSSTYQLIHFKKAAFTPHRNARRAEGESVSDTCLMRVGQESGYSAANFGKTPRLLRSAGFTLAEVLITIGIIGVVSAMTIPNLIQEHQKRATVTKLQKGISVINQAYRLSFDEQGEPENSFDMGSEAYFKKYWQPYIKMLQYCNTYQKCGYNNAQPYKNANGTRNGLHVVLNNLRTAFYTHDGMVYIIMTGGGDIVQKQNDIFIDINGGELPNKYGRDLFRFVRIEDNFGARVSFYGYGMTDDELNSDCSKNGYGYTCAEKIRRAGWRIEKDYPW